ncbi:hypothetical protein CTEN210_14299 [Chaetoceros tenuissimus]|uniref:Kinesin light chain n=1 Tax=Chaetoceros tenuissimus TaxID=426638 RepID=A0AAD3D4X5_9STRA|nr:hypothetical protein CTEN210_14299 [Chaetoceros tenuissimus]
MGNCSSNEIIRIADTSHAMKKNPNPYNLGIDTSPKLFHSTGVKNEVKPKSFSMDNANAPTLQTMTFTMNGIKLSYLLNQFVKDCGERRALRKRTTANVCKKYIKPKTKRYGLSYCDMILEKAKSDCKLDGVVGTATVFISHAWQENFLDVLEALGDQFKDEPNKIVWFDIFSYNQQDTVNLSNEWYASTFMDAIKEIGNTVLIMPSWNACIPLQRAWCYYELYCTAISKAKFEVAMSNLEKRSFIEKCKNDPKEVIIEMLCMVNTADSKASKPEEEELIHEFMGDKVGFVKADSTVFGTLRDWVLEVGLEEMNAVDKFSPDEVKLNNLVGILYQHKGEYEKAEILLKDCFLKNETTLGCDHLVTLTSMNNLAEIYDRQGKDDEAERLWNDCLSKCQLVLGLYQPITLISFYNLSELYRRRGHYEKAEELFNAKAEPFRRQSSSNPIPDFGWLIFKMNFVPFRAHHSESDSERDEFLGTNKSAPLECLKRFAQQFDFAEEYDKAETLYKHCFWYSEMVFGLDNPTTLEIMCGLANLYHSEKKYIKAEQFHMSCLSKRKTVLGPDHPATFNSVNDLAETYQAQYKYDKAKHAFKDCLAKRELILGPDHPDTLKSLRNLARLYQRYGKIDKAEKLYKECLSKCDTVLGHDHYETWSCSFELSILCLSQMRFCKAKALERKYPDYRLDYSESSQFEV